MQLHEINKGKYIGQADPFILEHGGKFYIYTTGKDGIITAHRKQLEI